MTIDPATPIKTSQRITGLDVLRGFALYGVFLTNAFVSARPLVEAFNPPPEGSSVLETLAWIAFDGLLVMKFVTLFSLLFGMGLVLQQQRMEAKGVPFKALYLRRLGSLAVIGILHGCFRDEHRVYGVRFWSVREA